jgi:hypothetical protein
LRFNGLISRATLAAVIGCVAVLIFAAGAQAQTVTVGPPLDEPESLVPCFEFEESEGCGFAMPSAPIPSNATVAPVGGTVVSWGIAGASAMAGYRLVVLRPNPTGIYTLTAASPTVAPTGVAPQSFPSALPIQAGEVVGVSIPDAATIGSLPVPSTVFGFSGGLPVGAEAPVLGEGPSPTSPGFDATIEPAPVIETPVTQPAVGVKARSAKVARQSPKAGEVLPALTGVNVRLG